MRGIKGQAYRVGPYCSNPRCRRIAEHAHHMARRTALGGDFAWIELAGVVLPNLTGLCAHCHDLVTGVVGGHKAAIRYIDGVFVWCDLDVSSDNVIRYIPVAPLDPQPPPTPEQAAERDSEPESESELCPACGQKRRRRRHAIPSGRRRRKSWCIKVPDDAEDGAEILDALLDDLAPLLHVEPSQVGRYYVVVPVLAYAQLNKRDFVTSLEGVSTR
jgi:hypothetical protein